MRWKFWNVVLGVGRRASVGPIVWKMKRCYVESRRKGTSYTPYKERMPNWSGHISRRNCLLKHVIDGKIEGRREVKVRRGRRRKQLLDDFQERRVYWQLKEDALYVHNSLWKRLLNELRVVLDWQCGKRTRQILPEVRGTPYSRRLWRPWVTAVCVRAATRPLPMYLPGFPHRVKLTIPALVTCASNNLQPTAVFAASAALPSTTVTSSCNLSVTHRVMQAIE